MFLPFYISIFTSLSTGERLDVLENENCIYKSHLFLKDADLTHSPFDKIDVFTMIFWLERQEFVEAINVDTNQDCYYWMKIKRSTVFLPFSAKNISLEKEIRTDVISRYMNKGQATSSIKIVTTKCPACDTVITQNDVRCPDCGLSFQ